jgi:hypothetical protein
MGFEKYSVITRTGPTSATPTISGTTNVSARTLIWRRDGKFMHAEGLITWSGAGDAGTFTVTLPNSAVIDTTYLAGGTATTNAGASQVGMATWYDAGVGWVACRVEYASTTTLRFAIAGQLFAASLTANGDSLKFLFSVPIVGWD